MTTPPRPTREEYEAALDRIHQRRRRAGDDHPLALSEDPREVLSYLRQRGHAGLAEDDSGDDVVDALVLRLWLWWEGEAAELWLLEAAEKLGRKRKTIGACLGLNSGQGLIDRIDRVRARFGRTRPAPPIKASSIDDKIRALAATLLRCRDDMPDVVLEESPHLDVVDDAMDRWPPGAPPPNAGVLNAVRFLLGELIDVPAGTPLRAVVDLGIDLVGTRGVGTFEPPV